MGIERARVVEVQPGGSAPGVTGSGYQVDGRLVLTSASVVGGSGSVDVRPTGTGTWVPASVVWRRDAAVLEVSDPSVLMASPAPVRWGTVVGPRPVAVTAMGFPAARPRPAWARDPEQWLGRLAADGSVEAKTAGMAGAALFAGAELVGVLADGLRAVPVAALAAEEAFLELVGRLAPMRVETPPAAFPMLS